MLKFERGGVLDPGPTVPASRPVSGFSLDALLARLRGCGGGEGATKLLHYGLQRSGTNFLEKLLKTNYAVRFLNLNWWRDRPLQKHFRLYPDKHLVPEPAFHNRIEVNRLTDLEQRLPDIPNYYLIVSKDPYSWWLSYCAWAERSRWPRVAHHYAQEYAAFYGTWLKLAAETDRVVFLRYIDLLCDGEGVLRRLSDRLRLTERRDPEGRKTRFRWVAQSSLFSARRRAYYGEAGYLEDLSPQQLDAINRHVPDSLMQALGYERYGASAALRAA